jgi:hypothetical protein
MDQPPGDRRSGGPRLDHPPSDRYATPARPGADTAGDPGSVGRAVGFAIPAVLIAAAVYVALAGPFAFSPGLVVAGIFTGRMIGRSARVGAGRSVPADTTVVIALLATLAWFAIAQVGTWLYARSEGGVLPILDYLLQAFGPVVPLVAIGAVLAAWWSAR